MKTEGPYGSWEKTPQMRIDGYADSHGVMRDVPETRPLLSFKRTSHWERRLYLPTAFLRRHFRDLHLHWQWRSTRQLGFCVGEFPRTADYDDDLQVGLAIYLWHHVFFAVKVDSRLTGRVAY